MSEGGLHPEKRGLWVFRTWWGEDLNVGVDEYGRVTTTIEFLSELLAYRGYDLVSAPHGAIESTFYIEEEQ